MLYSHANGESLSFHSYARAEQGIKRVPCAVTYRRNHRVGFNFVAVDRYGSHPAARNVDFFEFMRKQNISAEAFYFLADVFHRGGKPVASDMRLGEIFDIFGRAVLDKIAQNGFYQRVIHARVEFAVRERSRSALAELNVAVYIQKTLVNETIDRLLPFFNALSAL